MTLARDLLRGLLVAGERRQARGSERLPSARFTEAHDYARLDVDAREELHAQLRAAERAGAVSLTWHRFGGEDRQLESVRLADVAVLARHLGTPSYQDQLAEAEAALQPWLASVPALAEVLQAWRSMKRVRGRGPEAVGDFGDAARLIAHMRGRAGSGEEVVRAVSRQLFGDTKRVEAIYAVVDVLTADSISAPASHWEDVLAGIGLRKAPLPFLMAGPGRVILRESGPRELAYEYLAVSPAQVAGFDGAFAWVLFVENLATFDLCAKARPERVGGLVLYTGGMPSPVWRRATAAVLASAPGIPVYHWGDIDAGGFRIAASIAASIAPRPLLPWSMDPSKLEHCAPSDRAERGQMVRSARRAGWNELADRLESHDPMKIEQEDVAVAFPPAVGASNDTL